MRETFASRDGHVLVKSPNLRQQAARRRAVVAGGVLAAALASGVVGFMTRDRAPALHEPQTGPFSYLASQ